MSLSHDPTLARELDHDRISGTPCPFIIFIITYSGCGIVASFCVTGQIGPRLGSFGAFRVRLTATGFVRRVPGLPSLASFVGFRSGQARAWVRSSRFRVRRARFRMSPAPFLDLLAHPERCQGVPISLSIETLRALRLIDPENCRVRATPGMTVDPIARWPMFEQLMADGGLLHPSRDRGR